jgi:hypothetical protein
MSRTATHWTDERLDDLADAIEPIPVKVAVLDATVKHLTAALEPVPSELAVLAATVDRLAEENRALRAELSTTQQQLLTVAWGLVVALIGAAAAIVSATV